MSESTTVETAAVTETEAKPATKVDLSSLTPADRKVLVRLFGDLPKTGAVTVRTSKGAAGTGKCQCGACQGEPTASEFKSGHDMRIKSVLKSLAAGETPKFPNGRGFTKATAIKMLSDRNWK